MQFRGRVLIALALAFSFALGRLLVFIGIVVVVHLDELVLATVLHKVVTVFKPVLGLGEELRLELSDGGARVREGALERLLARHTDAPPASECPVLGPCVGFQGLNDVELRLITMAKKVSKYTSTQ